MNHRSMQRRTVMTFLGAVLLGANGVVWAAAGADERTGVDPGSQHLTLREAIRLALLNNRELQIQRINPDVARVTLGGAFGYYDPAFIADARHENATDTGGFDPADFSRDAIYSAESYVTRFGLTGFLPSGLSYTLNGDYAHSFGDRNGLNFDSYKIAGGATVRQPLLKNFWIDQGRMIIQVSRRELRISELGVDYVTMSTINDVQQSYFELQYAGESAGVAGQLLESRRRMLAGVQRRLQEGLATVSDETAARSQVALAELDVLTASNSVWMSENQLKSLLGDSFTNPVEKRVVPVERLVAVPTLFDTLESFHRGLEQRPDVAQLKQEVEKAGIDLRFRRNQLFPGLDVVAGYGRRGASSAQVLPPASARASLSEATDQWLDGDSPSDMLGVIFSMPLSRKSERENFRASKYLKAQADLRVKQREELVLREISDALANARASLARVDAAQRARRDAQTAADDEEKKLLGGKSTLFFVWQLQDGLTRAQNAELRAKADYNRALSQLHFAEGSLLEKAGVTISIR